jgi:hypothetical protein
VSGKLKNHWRKLGVNWILYMEGIGETAKIDKFYDRYYATVYPRNNIHIGPEKSLICIMKKVHDFIERRDKLSSAKTQQKSLEEECSCKYVYNVAKLLKRISNNE